MSRQSLQQTDRKAQFQALGQIISASTDRCHFSGRALTGVWRGKASMMPDKHRVQCGPQMRVMQLDRGTVKN